MLEEKSAPVNRKVITLFYRVFDVFFWDAIVGLCRVLSDLTGSALIPMKQQPPDHSG